MPGQTDLPRVEVSRHEARFPWAYPYPNPENPSCIFVVRTELNTKQKPPATWQANSLFVPPEGPSSRFGGIARKAVRAVRNVVAGLRR